MSGRTRLALCATLASLLTSFALLPLASPVTWFGEALLLTLVQTALGAAVRRAPLPRPLAVAAQAAATVLLITAAFAPRQALLYVLPGPAAVAHLLNLLGQGVGDVGQYAIPAPVTAGIRLLLVGGVLVVALIVDIVAVSYASAAVAGLPLLALYSIASGLGSGSGHWVWFLPAAAGYLVLLLAEGRDRLSRWGRVFSGSPRSAFGARQAVHDGGPPLAAARSGRRIALLALGAALVVPLALPSLGTGLLGPPGAGIGHGDDITTVDPIVSLQNSLNQPDDREVLAYRTSSGEGLYLRIVTLDRFDGASWQPSRREVRPVPATLPPPPGLGAGVRSRQVDSSVATATDYQDDYLPLPYPATRVSVPGAWRFEPVGRDVVGSGHQTTSGVTYRVSSLDLDPTAAQLAAAPPPPAALKAEYTRVPASLPPVVAATARAVTRGASNSYEKAYKLQEWFTTTGGFTYDTQVPPGHGTRAITQFLQDKRGFCVHFAFTMAAMARTLGIPARVDVGFVPGTQQSDGVWRVGVKDAHAWPELYFQGIGWTRFEPTPSRGWAPSYAPDTTATRGGGDLPTPTASAQPTSASTPSAAPHCGAAERRMGACSPGGDGTIGAPADTSGPGALAVVLPALLLALAAGACAPMIRRRRLRTRRLSPPGSVQTSGSPEDAGGGQGAGGPGGSGGSFGWGGSGGVSDGLAGSDGSGGSGGSGRSGGVRGGSGGSDGSGGADGDGSGGFGEADDLGSGASDDLGSGGSGGSSGTAGGGSGGFGESDGLGSGGPGGSGESDSVGPGGSGGSGKADGVGSGGVRDGLGGSDGSGESGGSGRPGGVRGGPGGSDGSGESGGSDGDRSGGSGGPGGSGGAAGFGESDGGGLGGSGGSGGSGGPGGGAGRAAGAGAGRAGAVLVDDPADGTAEDGRRTMDAWWELVDTAWDYGLPPLPAQTPRSAAERLITGTGLSGEAADAVLRVRDAVEQTLYARRPRSTPGVQDDVRQVLRALDSLAGRPARLRALLAPRSTRRLLQQWRARWSATREALRHTVTGAVAAAAAPITSRPTVRRFRRGRSED